MNQRQGRGRGKLQAWLLTVMMAMIILPILAEYFSILQGVVYYQWWPLLFVAVGIMFVRRWRKAPPAEHYPPRWVMALLGLTIFALTLLSLLYYRPLSMSMVLGLSLALGALYLSSFRKVENLWGMYLLCLLCIRPPYQMMLRMMTWMENASAATASSILESFNILHVLQGGVLAIQGHDFQIETICSGWVSLISIVVIAAIINVARNRPFLHSVVLLLMAVVCTWILNLCRITLVVGMQQRFDINLLDSGYLPFYQLGSLTGALILVWSADALLDFLLETIKVDETFAKSVRPSTQWLVSLWRFACEFKICAVMSRFASSQRNKPMPTVVMVMVWIGLAGLLAVNAIVVYHREDITSKKMLHGEDQLARLGRDSVVFDRPGWRVMSYKEEKREMSSIWGSFSSIWGLDYYGTPVAVTLDYPFDDWHDVKACYLHLGWKIDGGRVLDQSVFSNWGASETDMMLPNGDTGMLICSHCDHLGNTVDPKPDYQGVKMAVYLFQPDRMTQPFGKSRTKDTNTFYQTQLKVTSQIPLDEQTKEELRLMYAQFREQVRQAIAARISNKETD